MTHDGTSLYLISPIIDDPRSFRPILANACGSGVVAALLLRFAPVDERGLVNAIKLLAPDAQDAGAAVLAALPDIADPVAVAVRGGADGVHATASLSWRPLRERLKDGRSLGAGGLRTRDDAMQAGEAGVDYVMFGEPRPDGYVPPLDDVLARAEWWAEIFETPCVAFAPSLDAVPALAATGAEFVALGDAVWAYQDGPAAAVAAAVSALRRHETVA